MFGSFDWSSGSSRSLAAICWMYWCVGTQMSYPLVPAALTSFAIISWFEPYASIVILGPDAAVKSVSTSGSSYSPHV